MRSDEKIETFFRSVVSTCSLFLYVCTMGYYVHSYIIVYNVYILMDLLRILSSVCCAWRIHDEKENIVQKNVALWSMHVLSTLWIRSENAFMRAHVSIVWEAVFAVFIKYIHIHIVLVRLEPTPCHGHSPVQCQYLRPNGTV